MTDSYPDRQQILELMAAYMPSCVIGAAAELDLWSVVDDGSSTAGEIADSLHADVRAITMLLDALAALRLLAKEADRYAVPKQLAAWLREDGDVSVLPMLRHRMNILRGWSQLAWIAKTGEPAARQASIRGVDADRSAFVAAMHTVSGPVADELIARLGPPQ
ncbi:MAG: methyltransferase dimerization domain-containing protein, partial [Patescibacteria group bacterium]|nr:methyltransferase dimerization domain-containing protein [Patescibacteria group bacterium]